MVGSASSQTIAKFPQNSDDLPELLPSVEAAAASSSAFVIRDTEQTSQLCHSSLQIRNGHDTPKGDRNQISESNAGCESALSSLNPLNSISYQHQASNFELNKNQMILEDPDKKELDYKTRCKFVLFSRNTNSETSGNKQSETTNLDSVETSSVREKIKLLQQQIDDATLSADQRLHLKQNQSYHNCSNIACSSSQNTSDRIDFKLRALREDISSLEINPWFQAPALQQIINTSSLSNELVNETLNYFVNCGQRLSQMTKTYDDHDAYILLLQEKEVDLELAARIGQDLLKQNKELKDSIRSLEDDLVKHRDDIQQLKHELAAKTSLLDTFIEEEEHQTSLTDCEDDSTLRQQGQVLNHTTSCLSNQPKQLISSHLQAPLDLQNINDIAYDNPNGFSSLTINNTRSESASIEPFSSLPYYLNKGFLGESSKKSQANCDNSTSSIVDEELNLKTDNQQGLVQTVTFQLVESNKRLCELQDEIFYKGEQNLMQQEKIYRLQEQLSESNQRLEYIASENESLQRSFSESTEIRRELSDELKVCKHNFSELFKVFVELQKESRAYRVNSMQHSYQNANYFGELDPISDINNVSFNSYNTTSYETLGNVNAILNSEEEGRLFSSNSNVPMSSSLLEELQESMQKSDDQNSDESDATGDEGDSGVHTRTNISASATPVNNSGTSSDDTEDSEDGSRVDLEKKNWLGLSSFMLTTLLLLCLSVTLSSSSNFNLAQKLQIKLDR